MPGHLPTVAHCRRCGVQVQRRVRWIPVLAHDHQVDHSDHLARQSAGTPDTLSGQAAKLADEEWPSIAIFVLGLVGRKSAAVQDPVHPIELTQTFRAGHAVERVVWISYVGHKTQRPRPAGVVYGPQAQFGMTKPNEPDDGIEWSSRYFTATSFSVSRSDQSSILPSR
jgi:hypothetical protein